ncbi:ABC transporter permease subunit [Basilea psittacipulmonis]|uniref:ABC transmembrane type-1 domain-containing protein n=1 Tax=Basilea psittacipulmonis DSM 24701 TaxID=1072685 RepID=A0A077DGL5_9BURK|nr:ABC transporter permease subunit [Basilea psittacipulmonis]AIL32268.1 hypothetical protein IX83_02110 [Basilea psittacipulmonis DSM 24701]
MEFDFLALNDYYPSFWEGAKVTILITVLGLAGGMLIGFLFGTIRAAVPVTFFRIPLAKEKDVLTGAVMPIISWLIGVYLWIIRGTPILVQVLYIYFAVPMLTGWSVDPFTASTLALIINASCYITETVRGGILSVSRGLYEAGMAMGLPTWKIYWKIVMPVAFRRMIPSLGNQIIISLKDTSVFVVIGCAELVRQAQLAMAETFKAVEIWTAVALIYLVMVTIIDFGLKILEKRMRIL